MSSTSLAPADSVKVIAFYLPQFHPIPENDAWWGRGFTEWTNVAKARPLFPRHEQPDLPGELGFYDLRVPETREAQAALAADHGVDAFCYWHYWFAGRRLLERPFEEVLTSGTPDFPFCLAWANQTWSGIWHGAEDRILMEQTYPGPEDDRAHFEYLLPAFDDDRYLKVDGRPVFYVFRPEQLPDPVAFTRRWQDMARAHGLAGLYLVAEISDLHGNGPKIGRPEELGFDAGVYIRLPFQASTVDMLWMRFKRKVLRWPEMYDYSPTPIEPPPSLNRPNVHTCVYPNWDNTPRSGRRGLVIRGSSPEDFAAHLRHGLELTASRPQDHRFLWIKSWNEWAEGNRLEPGASDGRAYLEVIRRIRELA
ncbi:MAG TPA: glycoside hydrolase family 99-like domain-containing protein [Acidimicrobiales bacterium]|jgi:hypothetical protein|nr:glycoside hydrolase family 99-like domain-containing protein [Acidimicrobiales bacterium]